MMNKKTAVFRAIVVVAAVPLLAMAVAACGARSEDRGSAPILLFTGTGTSPGDTAALETILKTNDLVYATASSAELNAMTEDGLRRYRLLIFPGGDFLKIGNSLSPRAIANIHESVRHGLNYLGICAGAFLAGSVPYPYKSLNLTSGVQFRFYAAGRDVHKAAVAVSVAGGPTVDHYWEDGPQLSGWGAIVAKYPDGTPAIVQGTFGHGWVILTGVHAEAPESWRRGMTFTTASVTDTAFAATLIRAALNGTPLSHF
jgi:glutamine amidotransferase-like uncharacterized protein